MRTGDEGICGEAHGPRDVGRDATTTVPPHDSVGSGEGVILVFQDARQLEKMENRLQHIDRLHSLDECAAGIVHEIRNLLLGVSMKAQVIAAQIKEHCREFCTKTGRPDRFHEGLQAILAEIRGTDCIAKKALDFAHPERSQVREVPIKDIVNEVLSFSRGPLHRQGIRLVTSLDTSARVRVDVLRMKQVFLNIVRNARDAMPGGGELRVSTNEPAAESPHVRVEVADTGRGIAEENLERIFDPFFSMHPEGTGLGLAISRKIVGNHGGRIEVKSEPGKGTKFAVVLPTV